MKKRLFFLSAVLTALSVSAQVASVSSPDGKLKVNVDVKGGINIKKHYGDEALSLFIQPPSVEELRRRLVGRATYSPEAIEERLAKAEYEMTFAPQFDRILVNDVLEVAEAEALDIVGTFVNN